MGKSWAEVDEQLEEPEAEVDDGLTDEQRQSLEEFRMAVETAPIIMVDLLKKLLAEIRLANVKAFGETATTDDEDPEYVFPIESTGMMGGPVEEPEEEVDLSTPSNLEGEDDIIAYYNDQFSTVTSNSGQTITPEQIQKFQYAFEEDNIILRLNTYLDTPVWAALTEKVQKLGGEYIRGKGAHYVLKYP